MVGGIQLDPVVGRVGTEALHDRAGIVLGHGLEDHVGCPEERVDRPLAIVGDGFRKREEGAVERRGRIDGEQRLQSRHSSAVVISARMFRSIISSAESARWGWMWATASRGTVTRKWRT